MKTRELQPVKPDKIGHLNKSRYYDNLEPHEKRTVKLLLKYGFNVEVLAPSGTPKTNNPDIALNGVIWEMKAPTTANENTLTRRMRKASKQANRVIVDLRGTGKNFAKTKTIIIKLFGELSGLRRMLLIETDGKTLDFSK